MKTLILLLLCSPCAFGQLIAYNSISLQGPQSQSVEIAFSWDSLDFMFGGTNPTSQVSFEDKTVIGGKFYSGAIQLWNNTSAPTFQTMGMNQTRLQSSNGVLYQFSTVGTNLVTHRLTPGGDNADP
jgi:hypothetical protein